MHALVCRQPGMLELETRPIPTRGEGEALVRPLRVGICGTDYHIYEGKHPFLEYPRVMGHELAVEVLEAPPGCGFEAGEISVVNPYISCGSCIACRSGKPNCCVRIAVLGVHRDGGMASLLGLPAANLVKADGLSVDACATVEFLAIGAHAVRRSGAGTGQRGLVIGAGPIGLGVALFAGIAGVELSMLDLSPERLEVARALTGASSIVAGVDAAAAAAALTGGEGYDVVFDATGNANSMQKGFDFVAHGGTYVLVSVVKGPISFEDPDFHRREMSLLGSRNATSEDFSRVIAAIAGGRVPVDKLITHRTTLAGAITDLPVWATQKQGLIKAVIEIAA
ncbi:MAG TPA: zinc-binding alcohol dehydrogenase family protein [Devosia sp.]|jgi:2-desacetyl-2-hydroxyethyl bacteriochlorophyllide A dehydrogenase|uniref:zinc-binding alcohol dehydrogenase family protein n=1 Tax=Devosia sp. TaxID=1871048 RepID=UPI002DDCCD0E|nr:zinc-binding alcohol dehydrogenase family protein [Devosia sp.]HEV2515673.1 zinc-binding alcohol dehydrogenase family protein [Devosia sp.]